jgi:hypothetical protein
LNWLSITPGFVERQARERLFSASFTVRTNSVSVFSGSGKSKNLSERFILADYSASGAVVQCRLGPPEKKKGWSRCGAATGPSVNQPFFMRKKVELRSGEIQSWASEGSVHGRR